MQLGPCEDDGQEMAVKWQLFLIAKIAFELSMFIKSGKN